MATGVSSWSKTAATNASADSAVNWAEGQSPSSVNDSARGMMASAAKYRDDTAGIATSGTSTAYTVTTNQGFASLAALDGMSLTIIPDNTSGAAPTLAVDGLTAKPLRTASGADAVAGVFVAGTPYPVTYSATNGEFIAHGFPGTLGSFAGTDGTLSGILSLTSTSHMELPSGTTAQRPGSPAESDFRYNSTVHRPEFYNGSDWNSLVAPLVQPQGYLSVLSVSASALSPMPTSDQSAKTAIYYRPDRGNLVPISNGTVLTVRDFSELTLTLNTNHVASGIYDVFLFDDSGTITIGTGPVWNTVTPGSCARGTGSGTTELDLLQGLPVNAVSMTARNGTTTYTVAAKAGVYIGSIYIDESAGQVTCNVAVGQGTKWGVWNAYNRRQITLKQTDPTASWQFNATSVSYRAANSSSLNVLYTFTGLPDGYLDLQLVQNGRWNVNGSTALVGNAIGFNSTSAASGVAGYSYGGQGGVVTAGGGAIVSSHEAPPSLGVNRVFPLEWTSSVVTASYTLYGTESGMLLTAVYQG